MHGVLHSARVKQRTRSLQRLDAFVTLKAGDLVALDELADMARKRDLNVHQVNFWIGRTRPIGAPFDEVLDGAQ
jgi:hypothetical protein